LAGLDRQGRRVRDADVEVTVGLEARPRVGIHAWPKDGASADALLHHPYAAMYWAKRKQCGHRFFDSQT
jgi:GGDEF domain-containing protein